MLEIGRRLNQSAPRVSDIVAACACGLYGLFAVFRMNSNRIRIATRTSVRIAGKPAAPLSFGVNKPLESRQSLWLEPRRLTMKHNLRSQSRAG